MALQFSIEDLLRRSNTECGFYLITCKEHEGLSPQEFSRRHARMIHLMRIHAKRKNLRRFGGVRVFEEGETTYRMHAHWVMAPRIPQARIQHYATYAGLGHVWLDFRPATPFLGMYLAKYLTKARAKSNWNGVRKWACFGEYDGIKTADVEVSSPEIELFRSHMASVREEGLQGTQAYVECVRRCNLSKYGHQFRDTTQAAPPRQDSIVCPEKSDLTFVSSDGTVEKFYA